MENCRNVQDERENDIDHRNDMALTLWFCPRESLTADELRMLPQEHREDVWADLSGYDSTTMLRNWQCARCFANNTCNEYTRLRFFHRSQACPECIQKARSLLQQTEGKLFDPPDAAEVEKPARMIALSFLQVARGSSDDAFLRFSRYLKLKREYAEGAPADAGGGLLITTGRPRPPPAPLVFEAKETDVVGRRVIVLDLDLINALQSSNSVVSVSC